MKRIRPRQRWTRQKVLQKIRSRVRQNLPLNKRMRMKRQGELLYDAGKRLFGSWRGALRAAHLNPNQFLLPLPKKWTRQEVLQKIRSRVRQNLPLNQRMQQKKPGEFLHRAGQRLFGSWRAALRAAHLDPNQLLRPHGKWTPEQVIKTLRNRARKGQSINAHIILRKNMSLYRAARTHFGSYRAAVKAAGFRIKGFGPYKLRLYTK